MRVAPERELSPPLQMAQPAHGWRARGWPSFSLQEDLCKQQTMGCSCSMFMWNGFQWLPIIAFADCEGKEITPKTFAPVLLFGATATLTPIFSWGKWIWLQWPALCLNPLTPTEPGSYVFSIMLQQLIELPFHFIVPVHIWLILLSCRKSSSHIIHFIR